MGNSQNSLPWAYRRLSRNLLSAFALVLALGSSLMAAEKNEGGPLPLERPPAAKPVPPHPSAPPESAQPSAPVSDSGGIRALAPAPGSGKGGIEMGELSGIDIGDTGLLGIAEGGFGPDMWQGTERFIVERLLPQIPVATVSPAMNDLTRRFLLTRAAAPQGATAGRSILALRLDKLYEAGLLNELEAFLAQIPASSSDDGLLAAMAKSELALGRLENACGHVSRMGLAVVPATDPAISTALKIRTLCRIHAADKSGAGLIADLLREQGLDDPLFFALVGRLTDGLERALDGDETVEAVHVAMYAQSGLPLPVNIDERAESALWKQVLSHSSVGPETRLSLTERAVQRGMLPTSELASLYAAQEFSAEEVESAKDAGSTITGARRRALEYQMAVANASPEAHAHALKLAISNAQADDVLHMMASVLSEQLGGLLPRNGLEESAPEIIIGELVIDEIDAAHFWLNFLSRPGSPVPARVERRLRSLVRVADPAKRITWQSASALSALDDDLRSGRQVSAQFAAFELTILDALGYPVPQGFWERLLAVGGDWSTGHMPAPSILRQLEFASTKGKIGETVLLSLVALGPDGPAKAHPETLWAVLRGLERIGLSAEARRIGIEALLPRARLWEE